MIKQIKDSNNKTITFEFTDINIIDYIRSFVESNEYLVITNLLIKNYNDIRKREACKCLLESSRYYNEIIDGIEKMVLNQPTIYIETYTNDTKNLSSTYYHFESLYLNQ